MPGILAYTILLLTMHSCNSEDTHFLILHNHAVFVAGHRAIAVVVASNRQEAMVVITREVPCKHAQAGVTWVHMYQCT